MLWNGHMYSLDKKGLFYEQLFQTSIIACT